jgi:arylsulfatase A-like enzyme
MSASSDSRPTNTRRDVLKQAAGVAAVAMGLGAVQRAQSQAPEPGSRPARSAVGATPPTGGPYNILFILTDQERYFRNGELPRGFDLPAHERLRSRGVTFTNHRINSCVCTPSRSVLYTGQHIQHTKMFDNTNFPWITSMSNEIRTVGDMLRDAGYYTAYKGKWHLTKEFETVNKLGTPTKIFTQEMEDYGFSDYFGVGDIIAHTRGGYLHDGVIASMATSWLRGKGRDLAAEGKPWFLAVNLVNPHDVMFYDTDAPGTAIQSGLLDRTVVIATADHGDMDGAHRLHAKGAVAYREQNHVPLVVTHPEHPGGKECRAVTSHVDLAPTLVALTGASADKRASIVKGLPGKDLSPLLGAPDSAAVDAVRDGMLFNYNMFAYLDGDFLNKAVDYIKQGGNPKKLKGAGIVPDMRKRGAVRSVYDGRYVYARYFSPKQHNRPTTLEEIHRFNDVELFDTQLDPLETQNLAVEGGDRRDLVVAMNDKLNRLIDAEVGEDRGQMLPGGADAGWEVTAETMAP